MRNRAYNLVQPDAPTSCAVFSSPHSGAEYPSYFLERSKLDPTAIRSSEDAYVDELIADAAAHGAPVLAARLPRAYVDVNRSEDEIDPALVTGAPRRAANPRIAAGLGVIPRVVGDGLPIADGMITGAEAERRLRMGYRPYHQKLRNLLDSQKAKFGMAILFDCHSMPHEALNAAPLVGGRRPEVILGDRFGASCDRWITDSVTDAFAAQGFTVARNAPFAGGYITQNYGRPSHGVHALQIEIDRALYMDEVSLLRAPDFHRFRRRISAVLAELAVLGQPGTALAAE